MNIQRHKKWKFNTRLLFVEMSLNALNIGVFNKNSLIFIHIKKYPATWILSLKVIKKDSLMKYYEPAKFT